MKYLAFILLSAMTLFHFGCEEVIELDLDDVEPRLIIEAPLLEGTHTFQVTLSQSVDYYSPTLPEGEADALITLTDDQGNTWDLVYVGNGQYQQTVTAEAGRTYVLEVDWNGTVYRAESQLRAAVDIGNVELQFVEANPRFDEGYSIRFTLQDPPEEANYYRVYHSVNGVPQRDPDDLIISDDRLINGGTGQITLFQKIFESGDTVQLEMAHIDQAAYDYYNSLSDIISAGGGPGGATAAPANPETNWSNEALGYFIAYSVDSETVIIP